MKRMVILGSVLLVLLAAWFLQRRQQQSIIVSEPVDTWAVDADRVTSLQIDKPDGESVELVRAAGSWKLAQPLQYPANDQVVTASLRVLEALELADVISTNPANQGKYQVDSTGTRIVAKAGDEVLLSAIVGANSPDYSHTYVRRTDAPEVYRAVGVLSYNFNKRVDDWRDKTILQLDQETIAGVVLEYPKDKSSVVLARADSSWTVQSAGGTAQSADSLSVANLLRTVAGLNTVNFATEDERATLDFEKPDFRLTVETDAGTRVVTFVEGESSKFYAMLADADVVFQLFKSSLTNVMKTAEDLRPKES